MDGACGEGSEICSWQGDLGGGAALMMLVDGETAPCSFSLSRPSHALGPLTATGAHRGESARRQCGTAASHHRARHRHAGTDAVRPGSC